MIVSHRRSLVYTPGMTFRASEFEFHNRFWIFGLIFSAGFTCYSLDPVNAAVAIGRGDDFVVRGLFACGTLLCFLCASVRSWATAYLKSSVVHDRDLHSDHLVADGPYRYVRNPLYLGNNLLALGLGLMASRIGYPVIGLGVLLFNYRLILREEEGLLASQGENFQRYVDAVPRLLPALTPRVSSGGGQPNWIDGISAECFMWGFALGIAEFTITLRLLDFWIISSTGFALYFLLGYRRARAARLRAS
jgi:protein-S-isoprenylcysteine O-methyltransferase Ste14